MQIKAIPVGQLQTNCYVVTDPGTLQCAIIDPGDESNAILDYIEELGLSPVAIFLTHGHYDHHLAADDIRHERDVSIYVHQGDVTQDTRNDPYRFRPQGKCVFYGEGDVIPVGNLQVHVLETPGHSPGSVTLQVQDCLFTGDTLFRDECGRCDLPGGDLETMRRSLARLGHLDGEFEVYPGHLEFSTLHRERRFNPYMTAAMKQYRKED